MAVRDSFAARRARRVGWNGIVGSLPREPRVAWFTIALTLTGYMPPVSWRGRIRSNNGFSSAIRSVDAGSAAAAHLPRGRAAAVVLAGRGGALAHAARGLA